MFITESQNPTLTHTIVTPTISRQQIAVRVSIARKSQRHDGAAAERQCYDQDGTSRLPHVSATTERPHGPQRFKRANVASSAETRGGGAVSGRKVRGLF
jgi:hypothetical protein